MMELISDSYKKQLQLLHNQSSWGTAGRHHTSTIRDYCELIGARTILDYGCGRGTLKTTLAAANNPLEVFEYDPGIPGKDTLPSPADLVVATDVLEHIEPYHLSVALEHIRSLALKGAYFIIAMSPAKEKLPDGRNAHLIIENRDWWLRTLQKANFRVTRTSTHKGLHVWSQK